VKTHVDMGLCDRLLTHLTVVGGSDEGDTTRTVAVLFLRKEGIQSTFDGRVGCVTD
jgi:hypothetical protein